MSQGRATECIGEVIFKWLLHVSLQTVQNIQVDNGSSCLADWLSTVGHGSTGT